MPLPVQLPPDLSSTVDPDVFPLDPYDLWRRYGVPPQSRRTSRWIRSLSKPLAAGRWGDLQLRTERLDPYCSQRASMSLESLGIPVRFSTHALTRLRHANQSNVATSSVPANTPDRESVIRRVILGRVPGCRRPTREQQPADPATDSADPPTAPLTWAQRLKRVFEIDITLCPLCGGQLRVIADITDPDLIRKILEHVQKRAPPWLPPRRAASDTTYPDLLAKRQ